MKKYLAYIYIFLIFSPVFVVLLVDGIFSEKVSSYDPKPWPSKSFLRGVFNPSNYLNEVESAFIDRFPLKWYFIKILGQFEYSVFNVGKEVVVGSDGWLTDKVTYKDRLVRLDAIDNEVIENSIVKITKLNHFIENQGGKLVIAIVPLKTTIYPEYFNHSDHISRVPITALDRFQLALNKNKIAYVDIKRALLEAKGNTHLFYKTDVHWNSAGVSIAAKSIISYLSFVSGHKKNIWDENIQKSSFEFSGGEAASIPSFFPIKELAPRWSGQTDYIKLLPGPMGIEGGDTYIGVNQNKALLPNTLMFGNSFMLEYPGVGYHNYFKKSQELLDYQYFSKVLDYINRDTRIYILHLYETQLLFHLMDLNSSYWDKRIDGLSLPDQFSYNSPYPAASYKN